MVTPQVIALRSLRTHDTREMQRMVTEKLFALWESMSAMGLQMAKAQQDYALLVMRQWSPWMTPAVVQCGRQGARRRPASDPSPRRGERAAPEKVN
ncbi:MAG TPA: hypothetical protein VFC18_19620 [Burkholderiales bacterium]|nr:hypothetical protein [Burkholderiales bacterium]